MGIERFLIRSTVCSHACRYSFAKGPKNSGSPFNSRTFSGRAFVLRFTSRDQGSFSSNPRTTSSTSNASARLLAKTVTQSRLAQAGTTPFTGQAPRLGLKPTSLFNAAGTRPEPAVSVPREKAASPLATETEEPELEPPLIKAGERAFFVSPYGLRVPTSPVAN